MRKISIIIAALIFCNVFAGCSTDKSAGNLNGDENKISEKQISSEQFLEGIKENIVCLNSCAAEMFGADVDFSKSFLAAYKDEASYKEAYEKPELLFKESEIDNYKDYYLDPAYATYYPISNYKKNADVREYLQKYMSDAVISQWFSDDFLEYDVGLYLRRGGRGYGAESCDLDSLEFIGEENGIYSASIDWLLFDEFDHKEVLKFKNNDGKWILIEEIRIE